jgi:hypothetical protein
MSEVRRINSQKNYLIRKIDLISKTRRDFHRPTKTEKNVKAYNRKLKHKDSIYAYDD